MLWIKAFHIITMVAWFAGLFYLPRLFVYHAQADDAISLARFQVMESRLYNVIMTPAALMTTILGLWLLSYSISGFMQAGWMHAKLALVVTLWGYHLYCGCLLRRFRQGSNTHNHTFYRWFNEFPTLLLVSIVILVVVKP